MSDITPASWLAHGLGKTPSPAAPAAGGTRGDGRYLTPGEKVKALREWEATKAQPLPCRPRIGGYGYPDPAVFDWCDRINRIEGVCTVQSCAGHRPEDSDGGGVYPGNLWLRLSRAMADAADQLVPSLARHPLIERVRKHWQPDGQEIWEIIFHGNERGELDESAAVIVAWLKSCRESIAHPPVVERLDFLLLDFARHPQGFPQMWTAELCEAVRALRAALADARRHALEEAASECDIIAGEYGQMTSQGVEYADIEASAAERCASRVRALAGGGGTPTQEGER